jgi:hypothetical protein
VSRKTKLRDTTSAFEARAAARRLAWGPFAFQIARCLRDFGVLTALKDAGREGMTLEEVATATGLSRYGATVLLEGGISIELVLLAEGRWCLTKTGYFVLEDHMTRVNMDFVHDVNYQGLFHLDTAIANGEPAGLKVFGAWPTIYEGLSQLPPKVQESWFAFDHYYSDSAFPDALPIVFADDPPKRLMDVGGNTGKWAVECARYDPNVQVTILDLPPQLERARTSLEEHGVADRATLMPIDLLDHSKPYPKGHDAIWMSQFLCCFGEADVVRLLHRAADAVEPRGNVFILDTFWDRQTHPTGVLCLHASSLYFTAMANGASRIYDAGTMQRCVRDAGLRVVKEFDGIGIAHTLMVCEPS